MTTERLRVAASGFRARATEVWERVLRLSRRAPRRLRLCESLPLGERRFVAVVEFEAARFLVGGTPSSMVLLSRLTDAGERPWDEPEAASKAVSEDLSWKASTAVAKKCRGEIC
jgi:flagellar biogenesis protein FliO